jgi:hypothetical protein
VEWPDRRKFYLMINSTIGEDTAVEIILKSIDLFEKRNAGSEPSAQRGEVQAAQKLSGADDRT